MKASRFLRASLAAVATLSLALLSCTKEKDSSEVRIMHYFPNGRDIVCLNGEGRYTRALYGTHSRFRLETSDRPVFAVYDKNNNWNFRFFAEYKGKTLQLDSTTRCEARYRGGRRTYILRDESWDGGEIRIRALASFFKEAALWQFEADGFEEELSLKVKKCRIAGKSFYRDGDLGVDSRDLFEPSEDEEELSEEEWNVSNGEASYYIYNHETGLTSILPAEEGAPIFNKEEAERQAIMEQVEINTPDPFFNTIGSNLVAAADGIWDGETFLHGAVGWRTPLAGWRGAYVGDVLGWDERAVSHFRAYKESMVTDIPPTLPHPQQDTARNMAASLKQWGTPMYSNGYICRTPRKTDKMSHYDMNLNYIDELLTHFEYNADPEFLREMWPCIKLHHEWEKRNFDPDGDHLYDAYCCIWASDALYYNGGSATHSSAYNYRSNLLTARIAEIIGEDPAPYRKEAEEILSAMNSRLWMDDLGYWAEYEDRMGLGRLHKSAAVWSIYTPIDCGAGTKEQFYRATRYVDRSIPHIPVRFEYDKEAQQALGFSLPAPEEDLFTISTSDWLPYVWSTNNVAHEEVANMALAYLQAGRSDSGFKLLKADIIDEMYLGLCPGNFGQISYYDKARNEAYRDFADNVGISSRAIINGLFGIVPDALNGKCIIQQAFPEEWQEASIKTPYLSYSFRRDGKYDVYEIEQNFAQPLSIIVRTNTGGGAYLDTEGSSEGKQTIRVDRALLPKPIIHKDLPLEKDQFSNKSYLNKMGLGDISKRVSRKGEMVNMDSSFNANADDIFRNKYLSPRPPYTSLELPVQGVGEWCLPMETYEIEDDGLRALASKGGGVFDTGLGLKFRAPEKGLNTAYTSLWDNYPDSVEIALSGKAKYAYLLLAGSTNSMQSRIDNGVISVKYTDGSIDSMPLLNPVNWTPIHQDYYTDDYAFKVADKRPYRVVFENGEVSRNININFNPTKNEVTGQSVKDLKPTDRIIPGGAAQILKMPLSAGRELESLTLKTLSNDVVIGIMAITLER